LKLQWQQRRSDIQNLANRNSADAQTQYEQIERTFRQEYQNIEQTANQERIRINELHEKNLDQALDQAQIETNNKLTFAWNEKPLKVEKLMFAKKRIENERVYR
jgi:hypothetical protein